jgi:transposase
MSAMLKSFDPDAQVARDERISAERFMRMQLFDLKDRLKRTEDELKAANTTIERLRRKISKLETEKLMAQLEARLASSGRGKKRKALVVETPDENSEDSGKDEEEEDDD